MTQSALKYVEPRFEESDSLSFERRIAHRHNISGHVTAIQLADDPRIDSYRIFSMDLINISETGLGALTPEPISKGSTIRVCFTPHGVERGFDMAGQVVRCICRAHGHEIGIEFQTRSAA